ncbi:MAG: Glycosyl phosphatidyl inositol protein transamidase complex subunit [Vezdaea aestivalis]|nr:MAG: Glycosyl phosphatidyl inositol protein transamidase complex subunit [Vezdaea aestivalis]
MAIISPSFLALRRDPRILKLPPYLSAICVAVGVVWLLLLPLNDYCRQTYISENALLPGQVHTYFGGSEHNVLRAYRHEINAVADKPPEELNDLVETILRSVGLKVARQKYLYTSSGKSHGGENVYGILHAPRGDATEAIVLVAAWRNMDEQLNQNGLALVLTLARYFKRWSLWSKDIIFLITPDSVAGPQAWVDAYHDAHAISSIGSLPLKSGALQGALVVDFPLDHNFESLHISYDGVNGQLPNLDLFNTAVAIASGQLGIPTKLQEMWDHSDDYRARLRTMLRGMVNQGLGRGTGPHSGFMPYHVDAITLTTIGNGWQDEMAMGRVIESIFRSLNNLLEHFHQSFFFYLLMSTQRFVSIGTYLPSAMLVAVNFTIMAIALWIQSGRPLQKQDVQKDSDAKPIVVEHKGQVAVAPPALTATVERHMALPLSFVAVAHFLGFVPLYLFNHAPAQAMISTFVTFSTANVAISYLGAYSLRHFAAPSRQQLLLIKCFSLLLLGMFLSALATVNFSLAFLVGLLCSPLTFVQPIPSNPKLAFVLSLVLQLISPPAVIFISGFYLGISPKAILLEAAFGWDVWGLWTQVVVWCVWWPAWLTGTILLTPPKEMFKEEI